jgi:hypothetical protein
MTYLEIVNKVLRLMREPEVATIINSDDAVVELVVEFVNDAKRLVEDAHRWNALRYEWDINTSADTALYPLTGAGKYATIEYILADTGNLLKQTNLMTIRKRSATSPAYRSRPTDWAINGVDASGDTQLNVYPTPDAAYSITVYGWRNQADLALDDDVLLVPFQPVVYQALSFALRERGEVGGQTAAETMAMSAQYLRDAIALDSAMNESDNVWYQV